MEKTSASFKIVVLGEGKSTYVAQTKPIILNQET